MDMQSENGQLIPLLEGLIFTSGEEGLSLIQMQAALETFSREQILDALALLAERYAPPHCGIELVRYAGRWKFVSAGCAHASAMRLYGSAGPRPLSSAALEVLALVAYRGPITRVQIDEIRGVGSDMTLKKLQARGLVETCGHLDVIGRPLLYQVTAAFLDCFGLQSLSDLPVLEEPERTENLFESSKEED